MTPREKASSAEPLNFGASKAASRRPAVYLCGASDESKVLDQLGAFLDQQGIFTKTLLFSGGDSIDHAALQAQDEWPAIYVLCGSPQFTGKRLAETEALLTSRDNTKIARISLQDSNLNAELATIRASYQSMLREQNQDTEKQKEAGTPATKSGLSNIEYGSDSLSSDQEKRDSIHETSKMAADADWYAQTSQHLLRTSIRPSPVPEVSGRNHTRSLAIFVLLTIVCLGVILTIL